LNLRVKTVRGKETITKKSSRWLVRLCATLLVVVGLVGTHADPASAFNYRVYSVGGTYEYSNSLTGAFSVHADAAITVSPGTWCYTPYVDSANPVFLQQWVNITNDAANAIEIGTGHQCNGFVYHFIGYRWNGDWYSLGTTEISATSSGHYFDTHRLAQTWYFAFDGVQQSGTIFWNATGVFVDVGIESSDTAASVPNHWFTQLQYTFNEGPWYAWSSPTVIAVNSPMCGHFISATQWSGAENNPC